jgi:hypothetical protein
MRLKAVRSPPWAAPAHAFSIFNAYKAATAVADQEEDEQRIFGRQHLSLSVCSTISARLKWTNQLAVCEALLALSVRVAWKGRFSAGKVSKPGEETIV